MTTEQTPRERLDGALRYMTKQANDVLDSFQTELAQNPVQAFSNERVLDAAADIQIAVIIERMAQYLDKNPDADAGSVYDNLERAQSDAIRDGLRTACTCATTNNMTRVLGKRWADAGRDSFGKSVMSLFRDAFLAG